MGNLTAKEESQPNTTNNTSEGNNKVNMNNTNNTSNTNKKNNNTTKNIKIVEEEDLLNKILSKSQSLIKNYTGRTSGDPCSKLCVSLDKSLNRLSLKKLKSINGALENDDSGEYAVLCTNVDDNEIFLDDKKYETRFLQL